MSPSQFNTALTKLGLSQMEASRMLGIDDRTVRRYAAGDARIPVTLAKLLRLAVAGKITISDIAKA